MNQEEKVSIFMSFLGDKKRKNLRQRNLTHWDMINILYGDQHESIECYTHTILSCKKKTKKKTQICADLLLKGNNIAKVFS